MRLFGGRRGDQDGTSTSAGARQEGEDERSYVERLARGHLGQEQADTWLALLRPAVRLVPPTDDEPIVARLGGLPSLPPDHAWPEWEGHGPLTFVAEVDLAALAASGLDAGVPLPRSGRLLAFYYDGSYRDDVDALVIYEDPASAAGARLLHVDADPGTCSPRPAPPGLRVLPDEELTGRQCVTFPDWEHPVLARAFGAERMSHERWMQHPVNADDFVDTLAELHDEDEPVHQVGGWATPVQGPVEDEVAQAALGGGEMRSADRAREREALRWTPLLQVDSEVESDVAWGDLGTLYWLARREDLPGLGHVSFTWQCG